jgi:hypothetical protein
MTGGMAQGVSPAFNPSTEKEEKKEGFPNSDDVFF